VDLRTAWFIPSSTVSAEALCPSILSDVKTKFASADEWDSYPLGTGDGFTDLTRISGPFQTSSGKDSTVQVLADNPREFVVSSPDGTRLFAYFRNSPGCGGACATEQVEVSEQESQKRPSSDRSSGDSQSAETPAAKSWTIYKAAGGEHYVIGVVDEHLQAYKVALPRKWKLSCDIALQPNRLRESVEPAMRNALKSLDALRLATGGLSRGAGDCGSMHTADCWASDLGDALTQALYRPWALSNRDGVDRLLDAIRQPS
jgi:hypothetical protein